MNVAGTRRLAEAARAAGVARFVHVSTFAVHDLTAAGTIDEATPPRPPAGNDYAESKAEAERVVAQAARVGLCAVTLRLANVYGPFSTIFTTRPLTHLAKGRLVLVGPADNRLSRFARYAGAVGYLPADAAAPAVARAVLGS